MDIKTRETKLREAILHLEFCMLLAELQAVAGRYFVVEHPKTAISWSQKMVKYILGLRGCMIAIFDMAAPRATIFAGLWPLETASTVRFITPHSHMRYWSTPPVL